jgi:hypothetical protein
VVRRILSLGVKRPGHEAYHSSLSSAEVKEWAELYLHSPNAPSWHGAQLKKSRGTTLLITVLSPSRFSNWPLSDRFQHKIMRVTSCYSPPCYMSSLLWHFRFEGANKSRSYHFELCQFLYSPIFHIHSHYF